MPSLSEPSRASERRAGRLTRRSLPALAWAFGAALVSLPARAQDPLPPTSPQATPQAGPEDALTAARKLFAEALLDEDEGRPAVALDKFRRVREVRDTPPVEYRIGRCLEDLGQVPEAVAAYDAAMALSRQSATPSDVEGDSRDRSAQLGKGLAHLSIVLSRPDARVIIDGKPAPRIDDVPLAPGAHHVQAFAPGVSAFDGDVTLPAGGRAAIKVSLDEGGARSPSSSARATQTTWGWITIATGAALLVGAGVSAVAREEDIQTANRLCPGGACTGAIDPQARSAVDRARLEGPLAFGMGAVGALSACVGVALLSTRSSPSLTVTPAAGATGLGLSLRGSL